VFEIRTYTTPDGKLDALKSRFRDHTIQLFDRHNMKRRRLLDAGGRAALEDTLIYILEHPSREAGPEELGRVPQGSGLGEGQGATRKALKGPLTTKVESVFTEATDFSPIQ